MPLRDRGRDLVVTASAGSGFSMVVRGLERVSRWRTDLLSVLTYHRVDEAATSPHLYPGLISAGPRAFEEQVAVLASRHNPVSISQVLDARREHRPLPPRSVLVTFDDAYRDFSEHAWPVLRRHRVPAVLFVPTAYPDHPTRRFWWDRLHAALLGAPAGATVSVGDRELPLASAVERNEAFRALRADIKGRPHAEAMARVEQVVDALGDHDAPSAVLGWDELRRLRDDGVDLAPHSRTHALLDQVSATELDTEVSGSLEDLEAQVGPVPRVFAYPSGAHDDQAVAAVARAGCSLAFTTVRGGNDLRRADPLRLRRVNVGGRATTALVRAQLLPVLAVRR